MEINMDIIQAEHVKSVKKAEKGASLVEYALLVALIAIIASVAIRSLGNTISQQFSNLSGQLSG
jgi:pilus assembly protein Flp/PilA